MLSKTTEAKLPQSDLEFHRIMQSLKRQENENLKKIKKLQQEWRRLEQERDRLLQELEKQQTEANTLRLQNESAENKNEGGGEKEAATADQPTHLARGVFKPNTAAPHIGAWPPAAPSNPQQPRPS